VRWRVGLWRQGNEDWFVVWPDGDACVHHMWYTTLCRLLWRWQAYMYSHWRRVVTPRVGTHHRCCLWRAYVGRGGAAWHACLSCDCQGVQRELPQALGSHPMGPDSGLQPRLNCPVTQVAT
jgi:hypothetical protein